jgi:hypothetical protein
LQNYTSSAVGNGGRGARGTVLPPWPTAVGVQSIFKIL